MTGGLGIRCMSILVQALVVGQLKKLEHLRLQGARAANNSREMANRLQDAREALARLWMMKFCVQRRGETGGLLHSLNDGNPLKETGVYGSTSMLCRLLWGITGREGRYIHRRALLRMKPSITPSRNAVSHGVQVKRHDAVVPYLTDTLVRNDYNVYIEPQLKSSGPSSKYGSLNVRSAGVPVTSMWVTSCTLSLKGVWSGASTKDLRLFGVPISLLKRITI